MAAARASLISAKTTHAVIDRALAHLIASRAEQEHPGLFPMEGHPWTDHLARLVRDEVASQISQIPEDDTIHVVAANWRAASLLGQSRVRAGEHPLYDIAWRSYPADGEQLLAQPLAVECVWKGGWPALARGCDRLAQARADVKLITAMDNPNSKVGEMTLAEACAFRMNAFAPARDRLTLAFYGSGSEDSWRDTPGFSLFDYVTGDRAISQRS